MIRKLRELGLVWPTLLAIAGLSVLVSLGVWQLERMAFKDNLVARINERSHQASATLSTESELANWLSTKSSEYVKLRVVGEFDHLKERYVYAPHKTMGPGYDVYTPLMVSNGDAVWINRGFVPERLKNRALREDGLDGGRVTVDGITRKPAEMSTFTPNNDVEGNQWYWRDLQGMHESVFDKGEVTTAFPFFVEASPKAGGDKAWPRPGVSRVEIFNRHLEYALTWFGLALTLLGVFAAFVWKRVSEGRASLSA